MIFVFNEFFVKPCSAKCFALKLFFLSSLKALFSARAELQMPWVEMEHRFKYLPAVFRRSDGFKLDLWNGAVE